MFVQKTRTGVLDYNVRTLTYKNKNVSLIIMNRSLLTPVFNHNKNTNKHQLSTRSAHISEKFKSSIESYNNKVQPVIRQQQQQRKLIITNTINSSVYNMESNPLRSQSLFSLASTQPQPEYQVQQPYIFNIISQQTADTHNNIPLVSDIPLNIYQTWCTLDLPKHMGYTVQKLQSDNPEFRHYLYDDAMCREFIQQNFPEDVLYSFDKLKPGAYKSDLWRYCILYKNGGIYLDIKFECINGFKLIQLTDKEYYVRDLKHNGAHGIYQALLVTYPNNDIMYKCIQKVVENVKNNIYDGNSLYITGPQMMIPFFEPHQIQNMELYLNPRVLICNSKGPILKIYDEYRSEQAKFQVTDSYGKLFDRQDIYNNPVLSNKDNTLGLANKFTDSSTNIEYKSGIATIAVCGENNEHFYINQSWNGARNAPTLNSIYKDNETAAATADVLWNVAGVTILRLIYVNGPYYYASFDAKTRKFDIGHCNVSNRELHSVATIESPPSFFIDHTNNLKFIYKWFPLRICHIDLDTNTVQTDVIVYDTPNYFSRAVGSSCGCMYQNELWFVVHFDMRGNQFHAFVVFSADMILSRYSEMFKFDGKRNEICAGLIIQDNQLIVSYYSMLSQNYISRYDITTVQTKLKWYNTI